MGFYLDVLGKISLSLYLVDKLFGQACVCQAVGSDDSDKAVSSKHSGVVCHTVSVTLIQLCTP